MSTSQIIVSCAGLGLAFGLSFVFALHARARASGKPFEETSGWFSILYFSALPRWANIAYNLLIIAALLVGAWPILNMFPTWQLIRVVVLLAIWAVVVWVPYELVSLAQKVRASR
jgi:hypothetical protein